MLILTQDKQTVLNTDNIVTIRFDGDRILEAHSDGMEVVLGQYTSERCLEILRIIHAFKQFKNSYVMPEV